MMHLGVLRRMHNVRPVAVPVRSIRVEELADGYAVASDLGEACALNVTHCIVATDTGRHVADSEIALENRFHVLVEKPLATDAEEGKRLCARAREVDRGIFVGCVLRFSESLNYFRTLLAEIGRLHSVRIECQSYLPDWRPQRSYRESYSARGAEGGVLRDLVHEIDYAGWIFGWPKAVYADLRNLGRLGIETEEIADLVWQTSEGCVVSITLDYLSRSPRRRMRAMGEKGTLEWDGMQNTVTLNGDGPVPWVRGSVQNREAMFLEQDRAFLDSAQDFSEPRLATGRDGLRVLAVCDAARRSSQGRREEPVEYP